MNELIPVSLSRTQWDFIVRTLAEERLPFRDVAPIMSELARQLQPAQPQVPQPLVEAAMAAMRAPMANGEDK